MKHTKKQGEKAKDNLINYYRYRESDFYYDEDDLPVLMTKDEAGLYAFDVYKNIMQELRENEE